MLNKLGYVGEREPGVTGVGKLPEGEGMKVDDGDRYSVVTAP
jgi:hypothetical protein